MALSPVLNNDDLENIWLELQSSFREHGPTKLISLVEIDDCPIRRNQIFRFAIRKIGGGSGASSSDLEGMITIGEAAIAHAIAAADQDLDHAPLWIDEANISAYNLSANLCDCWGDGDTRNASHFEAGLKFADLALELRVELKKGPGSFSMAHWVRGKHLLSLRRANEAAASFSSSLACERELARVKGLEVVASISSPASLLSAQAFMGYAQVRSGNNAGLKLFEEAQSLLKAQVDSSDKQKSEDARAFLNQIAETALRN